jgi:membrane protein DedA with SNARE-associated domain
MGFLDGETAQQVIAHYGYAAIFLVVMLESASIPMPGETILISAAAVAGTKHALDIRFVIAAAACGAIVGDNVGFWAGREFGEPLLERWGHFVGLDARKRMLGRYLFARYGGSIVFFGRFVALLRAFAAVLAGANALAPGRFFVFNAFGGITWATVFGLGGYLLGASIHRIAGPVGWLMLGVAVLARSWSGAISNTTKRGCWPRLNLSKQNTNGVDQNAPGAAWSLLNRHLRPDSDQRDQRHNP